jgi:hypothetical protein
LHLLHGLYPQAQTRGSVRYLRKRLLSAVLNSSMTLQNQETSGEFPSTPWQCAEIGSSLTPSNLYSTSNFGNSLKVIYYAVFSNIRKLAHSIIDTC